MNNGLYGFPNKNLGSNFNFFPKRQVIKDSFFGFPYNFPAYILQCTPTTDNYAFSFTIKGNEGTNIIVDWGDGSTTVVNFTGNDQTINKTYVSQLSYNINFIGDTSVITKLVCSGKKLTGKLPSNLAIIFPFMTHFDISANAVGNLPDLSQWIYIVTFNIGNNRFTGQLFDCSNWVFLQNFNCSSNQLFGQLPNFSVCTNLVTFMCSSNQFSGTFPNLSNCLNLTTLNIFNNQFSGNFPDLSLCISLIDLRIHNCLFSGPFPSLNTCINLVVFWIHQNQFTGTLPSLNNCTSLQYLLCQQNQFTGTFPDVNNLVNLQQLFCQQNQFSGQFPNLSSCTLLKDLECNSNNLTSISSLPNAKMTACYFDNNALNQASVDLIFSQLNTIFTASAPTANLTVKTNLGTNAIPTGGISNTDLVNLINIFSTALKLLTYSINT